MIVSEIKTIKIAPNCYENPVYLRWRNTFGGWDFWLFHTQQKIKLDVSDAVAFERFMDELDTANTLTDFLRKTSVVEYTIGADGVAEEDLDGLMGLLESTRVQMYTSLLSVYPWLGITPFQLPYAWLTVGVPVGKFDIRETDAETGSIQLPIRLPQRYVQQQ